VSIKLMSLVMDSPLGSPTDKLVLIVLADYANDSGSNVFPSIATLARRCDLSDRAVQQSIRRMTDNRWISPDGQIKVQCGSVMRYRIKSDALPVYADGDSDRGEPRSPVNHVHQRGEPRSRRGEPRSPNPSGTIIEPLVSANAPSVDKLPTSAPAPTSSTAKETKAKRSKPASAKKREIDPRTNHPAILAVREITGRYPHKAVWDNVITALGDAPDCNKAATMYRAWVSRGFNPSAIVPFIEWYPGGAVPAPGGKPQVAQGPRQVVTSTYDASVFAS
jgi:hypothetical protein